MRPRLRLITRSAALAGSVLPFLPFTEWPTAMSCITAISPFVSLSAALGNRHFGLITLMCLPLIILAFFKHRWFCWNLCPTGFILELTSFQRRSNEHLAAGFPHLGKWLLIFGIGMAAAGYPLLMIFDPLDILSGFLSTWQWRNPGFAGGSAEASLEWEVFLPAVPLLALIALNIIRPNLWCHRICPLGAAQQFLGMAGRRFHDRQFSGCSSATTRQSRNPASPERPCMASQVVIPDLTRLGEASGAAWVGNPGENVLDSRRSLPRTLIRGGNDREDDSQVQAIKIHEPASPPGVRRRFFLLALLGGITGWVFVTKKSGATVVRPPGAVNENIFTGLCCRCGNCVNVCPESIILPDLGTSGLRGLLTPILRYDRGYCNEWCAKCLLACPTSAIRRLSLEQKRLIAIGTARIDKSLCLAWSKRQDCMVCQEFCPYQAIAIIPNEGVNCPEVKEKVCRGCGACESQCPAIPKKAITVQGTRAQKTVII